MPKRTDRFYYFTSGLLLLAGGALFVWGGSQHPAINARMGPPGSEEFFRHFVEHVLQTHNWQAIHGGILAGPLLWALGAVALRDALQRRGESQWSTLAIVALVLGALAWSVAFVFDGFVAPYYAQSISQATDSSRAGGLLSSFAANQVVVIRMGLVSWLLIGTATACFAISALLTPVFRRGLNWTIGLTGLLLGIWPLIAWLSGTFAPGPFISRWWNLTAVTTALWYMTIGGLLMSYTTKSEN
jgi:hypothetical protein